MTEERELAISKIIAALKVMQDTARLRARRARINRMMNLKGKES